MPERERKGAKHASLLNPQMHLRVVRESHTEGFSFE